MNKTAMAKARPTRIVGVPAASGRDARDPRLAECRRPIDTDTTA